VTSSGSTPATSSSPRRFGADMGASAFSTSSAHLGLRPDAPWSSSRARLKVHSGRHRVAAGRHCSGMLEENPTSPSWRSEPAQADREHPDLWRVARRRDQRFPAISRPSTSNPRDRGLDGSSCRGVHQFRRRWQGAIELAELSSRRPRSRTTSISFTRTRRRCATRSRRWPPGLWRRRVDYLRRRTAR